MKTSLLILSITILFLSCTESEEHSDTSNKDSIFEVITKADSVNVILQYPDIRKRNDSLLNYIINFKNEKELNELLNNKSFISKDGDNLEVYKHKLTNYIKNNFLEIDWEMTSGQYMIGKDLFKIAKIDNQFKFIRLQQEGFSNRGLFNDSISIYSFKGNKLELDPLTNELIKFRDLSLFTKDTSFYEQLECYDFVYKINPKDNLIHITLQGRPNSCGPGDYLELDENNIKEKISIGISNNKLILQK
jgi:hypothetical protein